MAAPEQPPREAPQRRGLITQLYDIETATKDIQGGLRQTRIKMLDVTGNPEASRLLERGIELGIQGGSLRKEAAMVEALRIAGKTDQEIGEVLTLCNHLEETFFGQPSTPPSERSPHASSG